MSHDQLRSAIDAIRAQLQAQLDEQLGVLERQQRSDAEAVRQQTQAEADRKWTDELNRARADWEVEVAEASAAAERRLAAESARIRTEAEQAATEAVERTKRELEQAFEAERAGHRDALAARTGRVADLERHLADLERQHQEASQRAESTERQLQEARQRVESTERQLADERERSQRAEDAARASLEAEQARMTSMSGELDQARRALDEQRAALDSEREAARQALAAQEETDRKALHAELEKARIALEGERDAHRAAIAALEEANRNTLGAELEKARLVLESERETHRGALAELESTRQLGEDAARAAERQSQLAEAERLLASIRGISGGRSLTDVLNALAAGAAAEASRAVVLVPSGDRLRAVQAAGFPAVPAPVASGGVLRAAIEERRTVPVPPDQAPAFAALEPDRAGLAVPIVVGGQAVAVLYADNGLAESPEVPAPWPETVEILACHASAALAYHTASRAVQAMRLMRPGRADAGRVEPVASDDDQAARRYARLLVSEIKLYNEQAVRLGREKRDLLARLAPEVERARRLYEERVPSSVAARHAYFERELRQTLADGDASLLGSAAVTR